MSRMLKLLAVAALTLVLVTSAWATNVTFQVNMTVQQALGNFTPPTNQVVVRGSFNGWAGNTNLLTDNGSGVYVGTWDLTPADIEYKFVIIGGASDVWESVDNRTATVGADPLTLPVVYFNNQTSSEVEDVEVRFRVNMTIQELTGNFDPASDWVVVRGNHANLGNWGGAVARLYEETLNPGIWSAWITFDDLPIGGAIEYKYVILIGGDVNTASWESSDNRSFTPTGTEPDNLPPPSGNGYHEIMPDLVYFSNIGPEDIIQNDVNVVFQVDVYPLLGRLRDLGYIYDVQTQDTVWSIETIGVAGFFDNWPWGNFPPEMMLNDNGSEGDVTAGDNVWSRSVFFPAGSPRVLIYKYGVNQLDVEAGFALNHQVTLDDTQPTFMVPAVCWGEQDTLYNPWQPECLHSDVPDHTVSLPSAYRLDQNFPNPFNPTTNIRFAVPRQDLITLRVFDLLGREVVTMSLGRLDAGEHTVRFDASALASGVYVYRLESPNFTAARKMLLLK
jgi:hypothetical protein